MVANSGASTFDCRNFFTKTGEIGRQDRWGNIDDSIYHSPVLNLATIEVFEWELALPVTVLVSPVACCRSVYRVALLVQ